MAITQDNRHIAISTPLGKDVLLLAGFSGHEAISQLFQYDLDLLSEVNPAVDFSSIVGKPVTITLKYKDGPRFINGIVRRFAQGPADKGFTSYRAQIVPWLWLLTQTADCRIFQMMTVPDIISKIFKDLGFSDFALKLQGAFEPREYCVQYRETDFNFVGRLMEQYGIYYYFGHADGKHTLVLANSPSGYASCKPEAVTHHGTPNAVAQADVITSFTKSREIRVGKWAMTDYNFTMPTANLAVTANSVFPNTKLEIYDYPGEYLKRADGDTLVKIRIEEEEALREVAQGTSSCRQLVAGAKFSVSGNARKDLDGPYVLTAVQHSAMEHGYETGSDGEFSYSNTFACIPASVPFRPSRTTPRPVIQGSQTAEVVGVKGEEIFTDSYGRVKVQFHWDREGKKDENSSCWIRVSQPWAGKGWGAVAIPRIGQEVVVDFLEGDPDQPLVTGRVYNADQMPPFALPAGMVISGVKSNSTKGGGGYNEISLNDTKGSELVHIHGQHDMTVVIEHDRNESIGNDETISVGGNRSESVEKDETVSIEKNRSHSVGENESLAVGGNRSLSVDKDENTDITGKRTESVGKDEDVTITGARKHSIGKDDVLEVGKNLLITAADSVTIKTGDASLTMKKDGTITLKGKDVTVQGSGKINVKASGDVVIRGSKVSTN